MEPPGERVLPLHEHPRPCNARDRLRAPAAGASPISVACLGLVVTEALLGGLVVESQLVPDLVLTHLAIATVLFGILLVLVLLSNLRELPRRWVDWARRAADETPATAGSAARFSDEPHRMPGSPFDLPRQG